MEEVSNYFNNSTYYSFSGSRAEFNQFMLDNNASHNVLVINDIIYFITSVENIEFLDNDPRVTILNNSGS